VFNADDLTQITFQAARQGEVQVELHISLLPVSAQPEMIHPGYQLGDSLLVEKTGQGRTLLVSLGPRPGLNAEAFRRAGGMAAKWLIQHRTASADFSPDDLASLGVSGALEAFCEGLLLGGFRFEGYKSAQQGKAQVIVHLFAGGDPAGLEATVRRCSALASGVNLARGLAEEPPNVINPLSLAERATVLAKQDGLKIRVLGDAELADIGAGGLIAVGLGSQTPSLLIVLEYPGRGAGVGSPPVAIVGKALTFDSGGYMLKDRRGITEMKYDKCGGAAVLGALHAAVRLELETPVVGLIAAAENMVSENAYRPGDIIRTLSGTTVEISNTDAEGRLVLADALVYACTHYQPRLLIDIATLTYGVVTALGRLRAGLMSNDDALARALFASGERTGERLWRLPLDDDYLDLLHSDIADLKNYSGSSQASPVTAGLFLQQFVPEGMPWAHLDILGAATTDQDLPYCPKGATGFGVRLLVDYLEMCITAPSQP
jgi:leucyl aminopeptidase